MRFLICLVIAITFSLTGCATREKKAPADDSASFPAVVFYAPHQPALTAAQFQRIQRAIDTKGRRVDDVWFIAIRANYRVRLWAAVYFRPTSTADRVRRGQAIYVVEPERSEAKLASYFQVTMPLRTREFPEQRDWPFTAPEQFSDEEMVAIVDAARLAIAIESPQAFDLPIMDVRVEPDSSVAVKLGWQSGPLSGAGRIVTLIKNGKTYVPESIAHWVS